MLTQEAEQRIFHVYNHQTIAMVELIAHLAQLGIPLSAVSRDAFAAALKAMTAGKAELTDIVEFSNTEKLSYTEELSTLEQSGDVQNSPHVGKSREMDKLTALSVLNAYVMQKDDKFQAVVTIDSTLTRDYLSAIGFTWPKIDTEYIQKIFTYMQAVKSI